MNEYILTFGFGQKIKLPCKVGGFYTKNLGSHYYRIQAESLQDAREQAFDLFGDQWAFMYESEAEAGVDEFNLTELEKR